jgi:hypothetical protein
MTETICCPQGSSITISELTAPWLTLMTFDFSMFRALSFTPHLLLPAYT